MTKLAKKVLELAEKLGSSLTGIADSGLKPIP
jgi:hypothetical protein